MLSEAANNTLCAPTQWQAVSSDAISFTCAAVAGMQPHGILIVEPSPNGTQRLLVTLPADEQSAATDVLNSFH